VTFKSGGKTDSLEFLTIDSIFSAAATIFFPERFLTSTPEKVQAIMKHQISDVEKAKLSDFVIVNNDLKTMKSQVQKIHKSLLDKA
ncbi:MAG: hypothetical protein HRU26_02895, partial [Psychroserpens sp.]|nr:hypothetical protein [Psychroserpens sp.]